MPNELSVSAQKVQAALAAAGVDCQVVELPDSTRSAQEAAQAIGCQVEQIVKSLVFRTRQTRRAVLVLASGPNRVNEKRIGQLLGEPIERADADFVREATGFAIGGVPPLGHDRELPTLLDESLRRFETVWCAAGTPHAVFEIATEALLAALPGASVADVS